jgi:capsular exopolysaccharide synthesis family protein
VATPSDAPRNSVNTTPYEAPAQSDAHLLDYWQVIVRRRNLVMAVAMAVAGLIVLRAFLMRPVYKGAVQILIERATPNVLSFKEVAAVETARDDYYQTQYKLLQSRALVRKVIESANLLGSAEYGGPRSAEEIKAIAAAQPGASHVMEKAIDDFLLRLKVVPVRNSQLVIVSYESFRPEAAADVANRLAQLYIQQTLDFRYMTSAEAGVWLGTQTEEQRKKVQQAEEALQLLKEKEGIVNIEERRELLEQKLKELGTSYNSLKTERLQKEALYQQMRKAPNPEELPDVMRSPVVQTLRIELATLERFQAQLLEKYLDQHPEVLKVRNQIAETRKKIALESQQVIRAVENDYKAVAAQEVRVAAELEASKGEALDLARRGMQYDTLKRELDASKSVLNSLLERHKETDVAQELKASNIRIVDPAAFPRQPDRPRKLRDTVLGVMFGLICGIGLAFFLEYLDNTLKTPEDVRLHLAAPLLSVVPESRIDADGQTGCLLLGNPAETPFSEGYRLLRTALGYCWNAQQPRVVAVTSTIPGEGKTTTAINLALTLAAMEGEVLLLDADLRKAQVHHSLGAKRGPGLSDILVGKAHRTEAVQKIAGSKLSILAAGSPAPSPSDLMSANVLKGLLNELRDHYAWIVIDTPPVAAISDTLVLAPLCDGVVIVAGAEMVPRKGVAHTLERIIDTGARVLGVILNRAQIEKHSYYYRQYYGHYYGQYYGHYYARDERPHDEEAGRSAVVPIRRRQGR